MRSVEVGTKQASLFGKLEESGGRAVPGVPKMLTDFGTLKLPKLAFYLSICLPYKWKRDLKWNSSGIPVSVGWWQGWT